MVGRRGSVGQLLMTKWRDLAVCILVTVVVGLIERGAGVESKTLRP